MGKCKELFYKEGNDDPTLHRRLTLSDTQRAIAKKRKDELLSQIIPALKSTLGVDIKHWLQGSYKNHTVIRPVRKNEEFDIDVGLYLMCNAEKTEISAAHAKQQNRNELSNYSRRDPAAKLQPSKESCERIAWEKQFHIDIPLYYYCSETDTCRLATKTNGWIDSDPKALQNWFENETKDMDRALVRRIIQYFKCWVALKWENDKEGRLPSIAILTLVANCFKKFDGDDDTFANMALRLNQYIQSHDNLPSPINGDDLLNMPADQLRILRSKIRVLADNCQRILDLDSAVTESLIWTEIFENMLPPLRELPSIINDQNVNLPAITTPPEIMVDLFYKDSNTVNASHRKDFTAYKGESLQFNISNTSAYPHTSRIRWMVKNQGQEAENINDLGHTQHLHISQAAHEKCEYHGPHYMECMVLNNSNILGINDIKVNIQSINRPLRNPPRKRIYKGGRR